MINVKDFGAGGDGTGDDTAALQAAYDASEGARLGGMACGPAVYHPAGIYPVSEKLIQRSHPMVGDGPFSTYLRWDGPAGGTVLERCIGRCGIKGFRFLQGDNPPNCYVDWRPMGSIDWADTLEDVFFGETHPETGIAAVQVPVLINAYFKRLRFSGGAGYSIIVDTGPGPARPFNLEDFTIDFSANSQNNQGFIKFLIDRDAAPSIRLANARIESNGGLSDPAAVVVLEEKSPGIADSIPAHILLENMTTQWNGSLDDSVIHQTFERNSMADVVLLNCLFIGPQKICGGSWPDWFEQPEWPAGGRAEVMTFGRHPSGSPRKGEWYFRELAVNSLLAGPG